MTDRTHPDSGRIITSGDVINDLHDTIDRREAVIKLLEQDSSDAHARITELESQLAQRFDAADMATAAAQGFRDGVASLSANAGEPRNAIDRDALIDAIAQGLHGTWHCTRVWEAWHAGTMSQDDFEPVDESETPTEIADAVLALLAAQVGAVESNTADAAPTQGATGMENLQRTAVGWQGRALRAERNWAVCRRWAIAGGAPVEKLGDDPDQPFHAASPAIEGESKWWPCPVAAPGPADGESNG